MSAINKDTERCTVHLNCNPTRGADGVWILQKPHDYVAIEFVMENANFQLVAEMVEAAMKADVIHSFFIGEPRVEPYRFADNR